MHGLSLGGYFAAKLASKLPQNEIGFVYIDRSFGDISNAIRERCGLISKIIFKVSMCWKFESTKSYINLIHPNKLISFDPTDKIILNKASLK